MSALGQKQTFAPQKVMSALPPKADICGATRDVCYGPKADIANSRSTFALRAIAKKEKVPRLIYSPLNNRCTLLCKQTKLALGALKAFLVMITFTLILTGCARELWGPDTDPNIVACRSTYGFTPGTSNFDQCMQKFKEIDSRKANRSIL
jgi:hypothetical protein